MFEMMFGWKLFFKKKIGEKKKESWVPVAIPIQILSLAGQSSISSLFSGRKKSLLNHSYIYFFVFRKSNEIIERAQKKNTHQTDYEQGYYFACGHTPTIIDLRRTTKSGCKFH
jgi:hypothetical protein